MALTLPENMNVFFAHARPPTCARRSGNLGKLANRSLPQVRFQHVRKIVPSADISHAPEEAWKLLSESKNFSSFQFEHGCKRYGIDKFLDQTDTAGLVILHNAKVILEHHDNGMTSTTPAHSHVRLEIVDCDCRWHSRRTRQARSPTAGCFNYSGAEVGLFRCNCARHVLDMRVGLDFDDGPHCRISKVDQLEPFRSRRTPERSSCFLYRLERSEGVGWRAILSCLNEY
jgi:hypothetical protein